MADRIHTNVVHTTFFSLFLQLIQTLGIKIGHLLHQYKSPNNTQDSFVSEFSFIFNRYFKHIIYNLNSHCRSCRVIPP